jgi:hypothetical protein
MLYRRKLLVSLGAQVNSDPATNCGIYSISNLAHTIFAPAYLVVRTSIAANPQAF